MKRALLLLAVLLASVAVGRASPTSAAAPAQEEPTAPILAIVSPIASPACSNAGTAAFLVPILGGVVSDKLGLGEAVDIGDVVLDALGPVYVVCGSLPASPGTRCGLDNNIAGIWPADLSGAGVTSPGLLGNAVDGVDAALGALGLPPDAAATELLECEVPDRGTAPDAPPPPPAPSLSAAEVPPTGSTGLASPALPIPPAIGATSPLASSGSSPSPAPSVPGPAPSVPGQLASLLEHRVPGGLLSLQLLVAGLLVASLLRSWYASWRFTHLDASR